MATTFPPYHSTLPHLTKDNWREHAQKKKQSLQDAIPSEWRLPKGKYDDLLNVMSVPKECGLLSEKDLAITEIDDVGELAGKIAKKDFSSADVALAFSKRAAIAHQLCNCLTEIMFDRAAARARELDDYLEQTGKTIGPLHGVPVSLKDQFDVKDVELTMGYAAYLGRKSPVNASLVDLLEACGAIIYVRTNVPQTLMIGDTFNHVFGRTVNPRNKQLSPGGSSGGEGALIALKGSILGVGTDIGCDSSLSKSVLELTSRSVRIPSALNGLFGLRPSSRRVPYGKATNSLLGQESILSVAGPLCRTLESVRYFLQTVLDACPADYDATALPYAFSDKSYQQYSGYGKLAFGYSLTDGHVHPTPPQARAVQETIEALRSAGHEVFEFDMAPYTRIWDLACEIFAADGGKDINSILNSIEEPVIEGVVLGSDKSMKTVYEMHQLNREKEHFQQEILQKWMQTVALTTTGRPIDGLIMAPVASPVRRFKHDKHAGYTGIFNLLDLPACVVPVTYQDASKDPKSSTLQYFGDLDRRVNDEYDAELGAGMPATVQIIGRRWQEEALLAVTAKVADAVKAKFRA